MGTDAGTPPTMEVYHIALIVNSREHFVCCKKSCKRRVSGCHFKFQVQEWRILHFILGTKKHNINHHVECTPWKWTGRKKHHWSSTHKTGELLVCRRVMSFEDEKHRINWYLAQVSDASLSHLSLVPPVSVEVGLRISIDSPSCPRSLLETHDDGDPSPLANDPGWTKNGVNGKRAYSNPLISSWELLYPLHLFLFNTRILCQQNSTLVLFQGAMDGYGVKGRADTKPVEIAKHYLMIAPSSKSFLSNRLDLDVRQFYWTHQL